MLQQLKHLAALFPRRDHYKFAVLLFLMIVGAVLEMAGIGIIPAFAGVIVYPDKVLAYPVVGDTLKRLNIDTPQRLLLAGSAAVFAVFVIKNSFMALNFVLQARFCANRMAQLRTRLFAAYMNAPYPFHLRRSSAELLRNAKAEAANVGNIVLTALLDVLTAGTLFVAVLALLFVAKPVAAAVMFAGLGIGGGLLILRMHYRLQYYGTLAQEERVKTNTVVNESLASIKEIRILGCEDSFIEAMRQNASNLARCVRAQRIYQKIGIPYLETIGIGTILGVVLLLVFAMDYTVTETLPVLGLFAVALSRLRGAIGKITNSMGRLRFGLVSVEPVYRDLTSLRDEGAIRKVAESPTPIHLRDAIAVDDVTFNYENTEVPALRNASLSIPKGASVAFVGPTGSGKTTLVDIILGLLAPTEGRVLVDGVDIRSNWKGWRQSIGYIPQSISLINDTIARNIVLGLPDRKIDKKALRAAVEAAHLSEFVDGLPDGLDTEIGDRGVPISWGQRQRIGIARALYHNPDVLVMDEATASLDNATERAVIAAVEALKGERTIIMIAHRLSTVENCDRLYLLKGGRLVESGKYDDLLKRSPEFRAMAEQRQ
jgi:ATP-binding cassette subfamily C protein